MIDPTAEEVVRALRHLAQKWGAAEGRQDGRLLVADQAADLITALVAERDGLRAAAVPHANQHPELYEWVNISTGERRSTTVAVPLDEPWRIRARTTSEPT